MFLNNWRKPWWVVFSLVWVVMFVVLVSYGYERDSAARIAVAVAAVASAATWGVLRVLRRPSP